MSDVFWAAFGGGAAAGVFVLLAVGFAEWLRWFLDRPLIKPQLWFLQVIDHPFISDDAKYLSFEAVNPHSKTVTLSSFGLLYKDVKKGKLQVNPTADGIILPYRLYGGESIKQTIPQDDLFTTLRKNNNRPKDIKCVYFAASSGKIYPGKIKAVTMEALEQRFNEFQLS